MATKARNQSSELGFVPHSQGRTSLLWHRAGEKNVNEGIKLMNQNKLDNTTAPRSVDQQQACSDSWLGGKTCADAKRLREMIWKNGNALLRTAPLIVEAIEDDDGKFALQELANAESQLRGLKKMLKHAQKLKIMLVGEEDDWPNDQGDGRREKTPPCQ